MNAPVDVEASLIFREFHVYTRRLMTRERKRGVPVLVGVPFDGQSSYLRGAAQAPGKIRAAMACDSSNNWTELGVDLGSSRAYEDAGDLIFREEEAFAVIESSLGSLVDTGKQPVSLGGDHSITYPIV